MPFSFLKICVIFYFISSHQYYCNHRNAISKLHVNKIHFQTNERCIVTIDSLYIIDLPPAFKVSFTALNHCFSLCRVELDFS